MSIVCVNFSKTWGGGENWHYLTTRELLNRGLEARLLVNAGSVLHKRCIEEAVPHEAIKVSKKTFLNPLLMRKIGKQLAENDTDTVILNGSIELKTVAAEASKNGVKKIIYRRGIPQPIGTNPLNRRLFSNYVAKIIANSEVTKRSIREISEESGVPIEVISNGITLNEIPDECDVNSANIVILSRLAPEKGLDLAIDALQRVVKEVPEATLTIAGEGDARSKIESKIHQRNLAEKVKLAGFVRETGNILSQGSVLLLPSIWEGFGFALLEGMRHQMPCVGFEKTSAEEIIKHGETGFLAPHKDTKALSRYLIKLLKDRELRQSLGRAGYELLEQKFTIRKVTDSLLEAIDYTE